MSFSPQPLVRARDIMTHGTVSVPDSATVAEAAALLEQEEVHGAAVVNSYGLLVGVVTRSDLVRHLREEIGGSGGTAERGLLDVLIEEGLARSHDLSGANTSVREIMSEDPVTATGEATAGELAGLMHREGIHRVFIVERDALKGVVSAGDLLGVLERYEAEGIGRRGEG